MHLTFRELPEAEWPRILEAGIEPFATYGLPDPAHWILVVAEAEGRILGVSSLGEAVHNHWHIQPEARRSPTLVTGLWQATRAALESRGVNLLHTVVDEQLPEVQDMVRRLGYQPAEGTLFQIPVAACVLNGRDK